MNEKGETFKKVSIGTLIFLSLGLLSQSSAHAEKYTYSACSNAEWQYAIDIARQFSIDDPELYCRHENETGQAFYGASTRQSVLPK